MFHIMFTIRGADSNYRKKGARNFMLALCLLKGAKRHPTIYGGHHGKFFKSSFQNMQFYFLKRSRNKTKYCIIALLKLHNSTTKYYILVLLNIT